VPQIQYEMRGVNTVLMRKIRQVASEPVIRNWLIGRVLGRYPALPAYRAHHPSYLAQPLPLAMERPVSDFEELITGAPERPITLKLAGQTISLILGEEGELFTRSFDDTETLLSLHRFAWLPLLGDDVDPSWVNALWAAWAAACGKVDESWTWHPYTASERAINILNFAGSHGVPAPKAATMQMLADHSQAIARRLEYFGDHNTSNHLSNNGRGLFVIGLILNMPNCADLGAQILEEEAERIFTSSGMLREGSSHYHLLLARNYRLALDAARKHNHPAAPKLSEIVRRIYSPLPYLNLPGGMPLIGDISPDISPSALIGEFEADIDAEPIDSEQLIADGWLRADFGSWAGLWHAAPGGWSQMPGHGHQDCGAFELHYNDTPVFVDPGRGSYGEEGEAAYYRSAAPHNSTTVDGLDPFPPNKPYFDDAFRQKISGPAPLLAPMSGSVKLTHHGYTRLKSVGQLQRIWSFEGPKMTIMDSVGGSGTRTLARSFCTDLSAELMGGEIILRDGDLSFRLGFGGGNCTIENTVHWTAYGEGHPATLIRIEERKSLPWQGTITLEKI